MVLRRRLGNWSITEILCSRYNIVDRSIYFTYAVKSILDSVPFAGTSDVQKPV